MSHKAECAIDFCELSTVGRCISLTCILAFLFVLLVA